MTTARVAAFMQVDESRVDLLQDGNDNWMYRVGDYAVRVSKRQGVDLTYEQTLLAHLRERGCPVPEPIRADDGIAVFAWLPGTSLPRGPVKNPSLARQAGRLLAQLHEASADFDRTRADRTPTSDIERVLVHDFPALDGADTYLADLQAAREVIGAANYDVVIHNDFAPHNALIDPLGIIDWDWACSGPRLANVGFAVDAWCGDDQDLRREFLNGYGLAPRDDLDMWVWAMHVASSCWFVAACLETGFPLQNVWTKLRSGFRTRPL